MLSTAIFSRVLRTARRFAGAEQGNIAMLFGICAVPILTFVGAAIDYTRASAARTAMQAALDNTALMLAKDLTDGTIKTSDIPTKAQAYFTALFNNTEAKSVTISATYTAATGNGSTILVTGSGLVNTDFMKVAGFPNINFNTSSTAAWGLVRMRVAMALDNTGSMAQDGKIGALRTAASSLVDQLSALSKTDGDMYISIVPFAKDVNVGSSNYTQSWIDWTDWDNANGTWGTCSSTSYTSKSSCESHSKVWTPDHTKWSGCVTDRTQPYDTQSTAPSTGNAPTLFPADEYYENGEYYCKPGNTPPLQKLMPLSYDWTAIKATINAMQPTGGTNQPIGIAWAWQSLQQTLPLSAPAEDSNYTYKKALIVLSDGLNTEDRWPSYGNGQTQYGGQIDARQRILCDNIKAQGITIYTVQVNTGNDPTSAVLQYCASGSDKFFLVTSANQTLTVFNSIGTSLSKLRVAK